MSQPKLKDQFADLVKRLEDVETAARGLDNQNFADIVKTTTGRVKQLCDHPDLQAVQEALYGPDAPPLPFNPNAPKTAT